MILGIIDVTSLILKNLRKQESEQSSLERGVLLCLWLARDRTQPRAEGSDRAPGFQLMPTRSAKPQHRSSLFRFAVVTLNPLVLTKRILSLVGGGTGVVLG